MEDQELLDLGACCACGKTEPLEQLQNIIMLEQRSPYGFGWGCFQCGLPAEGAVAVLCNTCLEEGRAIREFVKGEPLNKQRAPIAELTEPFDHDMSKHPEATGYNPDTDPVVLYDPETGEGIRDSEFRQICDRVATLAQRGGLPPYWRNEVSGRLAKAVESFTQYNAYPMIHDLPTDAELDLLREYFCLYIHADCWRDDGRGLLANLRSQVEHLQTVAEFNQWINSCLNLGMDPL